MNDTKASTSVVIRHSQGLHARPALLIARRANQFVSRIELIKGHVRADAKSVLHVMTLAAESGTCLKIEAEGPDAEGAVAALAELIGGDFEAADETHEG